jgi:hypothetical protein
MAFQKEQQQPPELHQQIQKPWFASS